MTAPVPILVEGHVPTSPLYDAGVARWLVTVRLWDNWDVAEGKWGDPDPANQADLAEQHWTGALNLNGALAYTVRQELSGISDAEYAGYMVKGRFPVTAREWDRWVALRTLASAKMIPDTAYLNQAEIRPTQGTMDEYLKLVPLARYQDIIMAWKRAMMKTAYDIASNLGWPLRAMVLTNCGSQTTKPAKESQAQYDDLALAGCVRSHVYVGDTQRTPTVYDVNRVWELLSRPTATRPKNAVFTVNPSMDPDVVESVATACVRFGASMIIYCSDTEKDKLDGLLAGLIPGLRRALGGS